MILAACRIAAVSLRRFDHWSWLIDFDAGWKMRSRPAQIRRHQTWNLVRRWRGQQCQRPRSSPAVQGASPEPNRRHPGCRRRSSEERSLWSLTVCRLTENVEAVCSPGGILSAARQQSFRWPWIARSGLISGGSSGRRRDRGRTSWGSVWWWPLFCDSGSMPCCMEMLHMMWMNGSSSSMNSRRMEVGRGSSEKDLGGDWLRNLRTSFIENSRNETNDASVSLVNVGGSACWRLVPYSLDLVPKEFRQRYSRNAIGRRRLVRSVFLLSFQRSRQSSHSNTFLLSAPADPVYVPVVGRTQAIQSIAEWVRLYRLSNILTFRFEALQSNHGVSGRSYTI